MKKIYKYFVILLIILLSGTVYFNIINGKYISLLFLCVAIIISIKSKVKIHKSNIAILMAFLLIMISNCIFNLNNQVDIINLISFFIKFSSLIIIASYITFDEYKNSYINILVFMCILSLISFYTLEIYPSFNFPLKREILINNSPYIISPYHTWGWIIPFHRNAGMFWEAGAFQAFLNLAIYFIADDEKIKNRKFKLIILIISLLSTKSTTGYIIFIIILFLWIRNKKELIKKNKLMLIPIFIFSIFLMYSIVYSDTLTEKFKDDSISFTTRSKDYENSFYLIEQNPLMGFGYKSNETILQEQRFDISSNSNSILKTSYMIGIPATLIIILFYYFGIDKNKFNSSLSRNVLFIILMLFFCTEWLLFEPVFLALIIKWKKII